MERQDRVLLGHGGLLPQHLGQFHGGAQGRDMRA
jgi:hypothetical protein